MLASRRLLLDVEILAVDKAGNLGQPLTVQITRIQAGPASVTATLTPPDGTITRNPGVAVEGTVTGELEPLIVHFFVDGLLQGQLTGLSSGSSFRHTMTLPGEGAHVLSVLATYQGITPEAGLARRVGIVTLDRTP